MSFPSWLCVLLSSLLGFYIFADPSTLLSLSNSIKLHIFFSDRVSDICSVMRIILQLSSLYLDSSATICGTFNLDLSRFYSASILRYILGFVMHVCLFLYTLLNRFHTSNHHTDFHPLLYLYIELHIHSNQSHCTLCFILYWPNVLGSLFPPCCFNPRALRFSHVTCYIHIFVYASWNDYKPLPPHFLCRYSCSSLACFPSNLLSP